MCGITGQWLFKTKLANTNLVKKASDALSHRGPDEWAYFFADNNGYCSGRVTDIDTFDRPFNLSFGHRRLSIIDLASGQQPMCNEDGKVWIVYNGEVYNFPELQALLQARGHQFKTHCDTEAIIHLYEEFGPDCVRYLRGMFSFAIWDGHKNQLFIARDRVGIKPLYYYITEREIIFASELKSILAQPSVPRELNLTAVNDYLTYGYIPSPETILCGIHKLPPASWMLVSADGSKQVERYWDLSFGEHEQYKNYSEEDYAHHLRELLTESVKIRLMSEVPLGAFLSGGIDSNVVVALMSQVSREPVKTFTIGFKGKHESEISLARQTVERYQTDHYEFVVTPDFLAVLPDLVHQFDEPLADSSLVPTYYVSKLARQHVTVALSGDGGDESYAGYGRYPYNLSLRRFDKWPITVRKLVFNPLSHLIPKGKKGHNFARRLAFSPAKRYIDFVGFLPERNHHHILAGEVYDQVYRNADVYLEALWESSQGLDDLSQMQYVDFHSYLSEGVLVKVDRASMLTSLEVRVPLLDHKVLEFAATIPAHLKRRNGTGKYILKKAMADLLPTDILNKPKQGFGAPINDWFQKDLKFYVRDVLLDKRSKERGLLNIPLVEQLISWHSADKGDQSRPLWALLMLELWCREYLDKGPSA